MRVRTDFTLRILLEKLSELSDSGEVRTSLQDALDHMGVSSPYRGGQELISLLEIAANVADRFDDKSDVSRIRDAIRYATNQALKQDVEIQYQLFEGSRRRPLEFIRQTVSAALQMVTTEIDRLLAVEPAATGTRVREYVGQLLENSADIFEDENQLGQYRLLRGQRETSAWLERALSKRLVVEDGTSDRGRQLARAEADPAALAEALLLRVRRESLRGFRSTIGNPHSSERDLHRSLTKNLWIFGGDYVRQNARRRMVEGTEFDIPLLRPDGSLHVVELKRANVPILTQQRGNLIPNNAVHRAVGQVMNYLLALDENRYLISEEHGVEVRRASATVIIGHPKYQPGASENELNTVLRTYNAYLTRVDVMTYKQLIDSAGWALKL